MKRKHELIGLGHRLIVISKIMMVDFQTAVPAEDRTCRVFLDGASGWSFEISPNDARILEEALREYYDE